MEDYAIRRKEYVQQVRASFAEMEEKEGVMLGHYHLNYNNAMENEVEEDVTPAFFTGFKLRFFCAVFLFLAFLFCKYQSYDIFTRNPAEIIDMISDNQYYTILQKYVKM